MWGGGGRAYDEISRSIAGAIEHCVTRLRPSPGERIADIATARHAIREGLLDMVAMTRAQIADPDVVAKLERGEAARIRPCVGANQGCVDRMAGGMPITCFHNPDVGREYRLADGVAGERRTVLVVGATGSVGRLVVEDLEHVDGLEDPPVVGEGLAEPGWVPVSGEHAYQVVGADLVQSWGGEVRLADFVDGWSTTAAIAKMKQA